MRPLILGAMLVSSAFAANASAQEAYISASAGAINLRDAELEYPGNPDRDRFASFNNGYIVAGALGRAVGERFRAEAEIAYRSNDEAFIMPGGGGDGRASALSLMANFYLDLPVEWRLRPYIGLGIGAAQVSHEGFVVADLGASERTLVDESGWGFAYQAMGGIRAPLGEDWLWGAEYRFFSVAEPKLDDADGFTYDTDYDSHALMVSLTRRL